MGLCLRRERHQKIVIGSGDMAITVTVREIRPGSVVIDVDAPDSVPIWREELIGVVRDASGRREECCREEFE